MTAALLSEPSPYGAPELKRAARPNMVRALAMGSLLSVAAFALAWSLSIALQRTSLATTPDARVVDIFELPQPPAIHVTEPPSAVSALPKVSAAAIPVPVTETEAPVEQTVMDQGELSRVQGGTEMGLLPPTVSQAPQGQALNLPNTPAPVDELPEPIRRVEPRYPDIALQAQIDGLVVVNVLVSKDGRVLDAQLHPTAHVPMLDTAALEAARLWTFEPALVGGRPVAVWVALPFRFRLR